MADPQPSQPRLVLRFDRRREGLNWFLAFLGTVLLAPAMALLSVDWTKSKGSKVSWQVLDWNRSPLPVFTLLWALMVSPALWVALTRVWRYELFTVDAASKFVRHTVHRPLRKTVETVLPVGEIQKVVLFGDNHGSGWLETKAGGNFVFAEGRLDRIRPDARAMSAAIRVPLEERKPEVIPND